MAKKQKMIVAAKTRDEVEQLVGKCGRLTIERDEISNTMDAELQTVRERHEVRLAAIESELAEINMSVELWAGVNGPEFDGLKSIELMHGSIGFRTGQPALKTLKGFTWERVEEKLQQNGLTAYIREKKEVDKAKLLGLPTDHKDREKFPVIGVFVHQAETFFIQPNRDGDRVRIVTGGDA